MGEGARAGNLALIRRRDAMSVTDPAPLLDLETDPAPPEQDSSF